MAAPVFRAGNGSHGFATPCVFNLPTGTASGDILLLNMYVDGTNVAVTPPAGWTLLDNTTQSGPFNQRVWYKIAGASEPASYSFSSASSMDGSLCAYSGVDNTTPINVHESQAGATASSLTTTNANTLLVCLTTNYAGTTNVPTGFTLAENNGDGSYQSYKVQATAGATGSVTASGTQTVIALLALNPAGSGGTTHALATITRSKFVTRAGLVSRTRTHFATRTALSEGTRGKFFVRTGLASRGRGNFLTRTSLMVGARGRFLTRAILANRARATFRTRLHMLVGTRTAFATRFSFADVARSSFKIALANTKALMSQARVKFVSRAQQATTARARFAIRFHYVEVSRSRFAIRVPLAIKVRSRFATRISQQVTTRVQFTTRMVLVGRAVSRFVISGLVVPGALKAKFFSLTRFAAQFATAAHLKATFAAASTLRASFVRSLLVAQPFSTLDVTATVTKASDGTFPTMQTVTLAVTFPDGTTSNFSLTSGISPLGNGQYRVTYTTKGVGTNHELWTFTAVDGSTLEATNVTPVSF